MTTARWLPQIWPQSDVGWILAVALVTVFAVLAYRIIIHGMRSGKELRVGKWFTWR